MIGAHSDPVENLDWLHEPRIPRDGHLLDASILNFNLIGSQSEYREAVSVVQYREKLVERYGYEVGMHTNFAKAFSVCEYGTTLTAENSGILFPF